MRYFIVQKDGFYFPYIETPYKPWWGFGKITRNKIHRVGKDADYYGMNLIGYNKYQEALDALIAELKKFEKEKVTTIWEFSSKLHNGALTLVGKGSKR